MELLAGCGNAGDSSCSRGPSRFIDPQRCSDARARAMDGCQRCGAPSAKSGQLPLCATDTWKVCKMLGMKQLQKQLQVSRKEERVLAGIHDGKSRRATGGPARPGTCPRLHVQGLSWPEQAGGESPGSLTCGDSAITGPKLFNLHRMAVSLGNKRQSFLEPAQYGTARRTQATVVRANSPEHRIRSHVPQCRPRCDPSKGSVLAVPPTAIQQVVAGSPAPRCARRRSIR